MLKNKYILFLIVSLTINFVNAQIVLPDAPEVDTVSVEPISVKGDVYISWFAMDPVEIAAYIIYRNIGTTNNPIWQNLDTVFGGASTFYLDLASGPQNADGQPESYRLRSIDTAGTKSLLSDSMTTIYTFPYIEENNCIKHIRVHWTSYGGWKTGVTKYDVYCSINNGAYFLLGTSSGISNEFYHNGIADSTSYSYYVRATSATGQTSTSNSVRTYTDFLDKPIFINADYATVENSSIKLEYSLDDSAEVRNYRLMRADSINGSYNEVVTYYNWPLDKMEYKDNNVNPENVYFYRLDAIDPCGNIILSSNDAKNIKINVTSNNDFTPVITWDRYIDWLGGDVEYNVYRIINSSTKLIYTSYIGVNYYKDEIPQEEISKISGKVCYMVEAKEGPGNPYGVQGYSRSTIKCLEQESYVVMPDAFTPNNDQINDIFKPLAIFISNEDYRFEIFNRWGESIYYTTDPSEGWDGRDSKGRVSPENIYYYLLKYTNFYGETFKLAGEVTLLF